MANEDTNTVVLEVRGRTVEEPSLPRVLQPRVRSAGPVGEDPFLPPGYARPVAAVDLSAAARAVEGATPKEVPAPRGQVVAIDLADGVTVFTSPENLKDTLSRIAPDAVQGDRVRLDALEETGPATRGVLDLASRLITRVTTLDIGTTSDAIIDAARQKATEWLREKGEEKLAEYAELGVSWIGTKALMWAIESRLARQPGLYRWVAARAEPTDLSSNDPKRLEADAKDGPLLVFVHGTGSSTTGSYSDLQNASPDYWRQIAARFGDRIYAFEHRTLSESPIENALQLARALPSKARINLVTHSRGGLVGDLLCLDRLDGVDRALIDAYAVDDLALGAVEDDGERRRLERELERAYAEQRAHLRELGAALRVKQLVIERYVRVASPARGTRLASSNFDVFLSGLLTLIGLVPALATTPLYSAFKRVVLEVAKNRTKPNLVPGIEAMLPESPMARLLARATPQSGTRVAVIAGDVEGGGLLKRLGVLFTDQVFFNGFDNDLVVDTDAMYAGVARPGQARALFDQGAEVSHFRYFTNATTRDALRQWLLDPNVDGIKGFEPLPGLGTEGSARQERARDEQRRRSRGSDGADLPVVVVIPGFMGSHLWANRRDRVWFDFDRLMAGGLGQIRIDAPNLEAEKLLSRLYGDLCDHLATSHVVERFAYDWRRPLEASAGALAARLRTLLGESAAPERPVRLLAHGMGGLVARALVYTHPDVWQALMTRTGARFVMLGTPNLGSHSMVETLAGKSATVRMLASVGPKRNLQGVLDIIAAFPGALQLLPRTGFIDTGGKRKDDYFTPAAWQEIKGAIRDAWFGKGVVAQPRKEDLTVGSWLWEKDKSGAPLPLEHEDKVLYVHGCAPNTPCGIDDQGQRWRMLGTPKGDGAVTWASGKLPGIGDYFYMPVEHGALADTKEYFSSIESLLANGQDTRLSKEEPAVRGEANAPTVAYDAGPPICPTAVEMAAGLAGRRTQVPARDRARPRLRVCVKAMDLRFATRPILVGHYEQDAISGAEALIDRELVKGALTVRYNLGMYAGPRGTATVVLPARNELERQRGSARGAVVAGLGKYDGTLGSGTLTEAVRTAALRYLLHLYDALETEPLTEAEADVSLASLLLGYDSSANISISDSVAAVVRGVAEANRKFAESTQSPLRIASLDIVELYLDTAISATYALQRVARTLNSEPNLGCQIEAEEELREGEGLRLRLQDARAAQYWSRIVISDADRRDDECPSECYTRCPPECSEDAYEEKRDPAAGGDTSAHLVPVPDRRMPAWLRRRLALAERLRFLYLGQRARAETIVQQRQPGLVEKLVAQQLHVRSYQPDFSRTLFQLLIPNDFKDAARQLDRLVLVLDGYTANLPWELMLAGDRPLAVKTAIVRQLASTKFRAVVRQTLAKRAYVVGNPSTQGFSTAFPNPRPGEQKDPPSLQSAENEAATVTEVLAQYGYDVTRAIGQDQEALDVVNRLFVHPYRVLHIAAHGVFDQRHADGTTRSGVVLSGGVLLTAAEIGSMEVVPDLVFLNCCHLGKVDRAPAAFNRLAYSVSRELIEMGVRAVVAAGWAVDDDAASLFAETFYRGMLGEGKPLGDAAYEARRAVWDRFPSSITWGAYQVYGDPGWRLDPESEGGRGSTASKPVAPEEFIARIDARRMAALRVEQALSKSEISEIAGAVEQQLRDVEDRNWLKRLDVCAALGRFYGDLGPDYFRKAREYYQRAIAGSDSWGRAPVSAIEQIANFEAREGEARGDERLVRRAIDRLIALDALVAEDSGAGARNIERTGLLSGAYKRLAAVHARKYLKTKRQQHAKAMKAALEKSREQYESLLKPDATGVDPYNGLNGLFLEALVPGSSRKDRIDYARKCAVAASSRFAADPTFWNAVMVADAYLVEALLDDRFRGTDADAWIDKVEAKYRATWAGVNVRARELDSTAQQMCLMALFFEAHDQSGAAQGGGGSGVARALREIANRLVPGGCAAPVVKMGGPRRSKAKETPAPPVAPMTGAGTGPAPAGKSGSPGTRRRRRQQ